MVAVRMSVLIFHLWCPIEANNCVSARVHPAIDTPAILANVRDIVLGTASTSRMELTPDNDACGTRGSILAQDEWKATTLCPNSEN